MAKQRCQPSSPWPLTCIILVSLESLFQHSRTHTHLRLRVVGSQKFMRPLKWIVSMHSDMQPLWRSLHDASGRTIIFKNQSSVHLPASQPHYLEPNQLRSCDIFWVDVFLWLGVDIPGFELQFYDLSALRPWADCFPLSLGLLIYKEE